LESGTEYEKVYIVVNMLLKFKEKTSYELVDKIVGDASNAAVEDKKKLRRVCGYQQELCISF
jgi:hypothetical protein